MKYILTLLFAVNLLFAPVTQAQSTQDIICQNNPNMAECQGASESTILGIIGNVIDVLMWIVGVGAVIVIIVAGFMYVISGGNSDTTKKAKDAIIYSLVGVVIVFFARAIVQFVLSSV